MALDRILHGGLPCRSEAEASRDRERADRLHYRIQAHNIAEAIRGGRHDLTVIDFHWPECPEGVKAQYRQNIETWLRFLRELRALHTASIRYVHGMQETLAGRPE